MTVEPAMRWKGLRLMLLLSFAGCGQNALVSNVLEGSGGSGTGSGTGGADPGTGGQGTGGQGTGGAFISGAAGEHGTGGAFIGGAAGGGGTYLPPSCPSISTTPGFLNPCGHTFGVAISADGQLLAAAMALPPPNVHIWRLSDGALMHDIDGFGETAYSVSFSPDGRTLAAAGEGGDIVKLYDVDSGALLRTLPASCGFYADTAAFSPDGTLLATAGYGGPVEVWRVADGVRVAAIPYPTSVHNVHFSPDGTRLIVGGVDERATVWNVATATLTLTLYGIANEQADAVFSPDERLIASTSANNNDVLVWDAASGAQLQEMAGHQAYVSKILWIDQDRFISDDWSGVVNSWTRAGTGAFSLSATYFTGSQATGIALWPNHAGGPIVVTGGGGASIAVEGFVFIAL